MKRPILTREHEADLIQRYQAGDRKAGDVVARAAIGFVVSEARKFQSYQRVEFDELVAAGNLGLVKAMRKFDPGRGTRLSTYAKRWIHCYILGSILAGWSIGGRADQAFRSDNFWKAQRAIAKSLSRTGDEDQALREAAQELKVKPEVLRKMLDRIEHRDVSLDAPREGGPLLNRLQAVDTVPDAELEAREKAASEQSVVRHLLGCLDARELRIIVDSMMADEPRSMSAIAKDFGITREWTRQLRNRAVRKIREELGA